MLTEAQKKFLLKIFEINTDTNKLPGWKGIAENLINHGGCIVAGEKSIWHGGIGNFINTSHAEGTIGCLMYKFDANYFMTSEWYKELLQVHKQALKLEIEKQQAILTELTQELLDL